jgi:AcrR family transcriptional regulator
MRDLSVAGDNWRRPPVLATTPVEAAVIEAFTENGYHGTTVRDIAQRANVTVPALYYHYKNKECMLAAVMNDATNHLHALCLDALESAGPEPRARLVNLIECLALFMMHVPSLDSEMRYLGSEYMKEYAQNRRRIEMLLLNTIYDGIAAGRFNLADPRSTARALLGMTLAISTWYRPGGSRQSEEIAATYASIALRTVGADVSEPV